MTLFLDAFIRYQQKYKVPSFNLGHPILCALQIYLLTCIQLWLSSDMLTLAGHWYVFCTVVIH